MKIFRQVTMAAIGAVALAIVAPQAMAQSAQLAAKSRNPAEISADMKSKGKARVIVEFSISSSDVRAKAGLAARKAAVKAGQDSIFAAVFGSVNAALADRDRGLSRLKTQPMFALWVNEAELEALAANPRVTSIYSDGIAKPVLIDSVPLIGAKKLQKLGGTGEGFIVAIEDTGVESSHDFLRPRVIFGACFSTNTGGFTSTCRGGATEDEGKKAGEPCTVSSSCFHGTHVAGIAAGKLRNAGAHLGAPKVGVAPKAKIIAIKVFSFSSSSGLIAFFSDMARGLDWLFDHRSDFPGLTVASVNMSIGNSVSHATNCDATDPLTSIINDLRSVNIASTISAGNNGFRNGVSEPACVSPAITVGSTQKDDVISGFSNIGDLVDVMAPGGCSSPCSGAIQSSVTGNAFGFASGTSMAAPHVAGAWAALRSLHSGSSVSQIESALESTGKPITDTRPSGTFTKPRINVKAANGALP